MAKKRYKFNPQTLTYEVITIPFRIKFYRLLRQVLIGFMLASMLNLAVSFFFYTPKMYRINENRNELLLKYQMLNDKVEAATARLDEINHRDNQVYRPLFGEDSLSIYGIHTPYPDSKYEHLSEDRYATLMKGSWMRLDALARRLYAESKSMDELEVLSQNKSFMSEAIPAIWPLDKRLLRGHIGAYGTRRHPISGRLQKHDGIDLGGKTGTPIYATGNATVVSTKSQMAGYGKQVLLDHGFGYKTRYAHLSNVLVEEGQSVKRGEIIGELGNTGRSTGPHLHYEVIYRNRTVDPLNYFSRDMSEEEFAKVIESAKATTYESEE